MAYNKKGLNIRVDKIRELTTAHYERERHDRCYKWVWRRYIYPQYGICYITYLSYIKKNDSKKTITNYPELPFED